MMAPFADRSHAGACLAAELIALGVGPNRGPGEAKLGGADSETLVLGLPRGGVVVAHAIAEKLNAPLDALIVRKLGAPGQEELAIGAIASGGICVRNEALIGALGLGEEEIAEIVAREERELHAREYLYGVDRTPSALEGKTLILADDGLATGATMRAAVQALRSRWPARVIVAVPVGSHEACGSLRDMADRVICLRTPDPFYSVGAWYEDFRQVTDEEVCKLLARSRGKRRGPREGEV